jgi:hypothetical protein
VPPRYVPTNVETVAGLDEIVATVTLQLEVVGQSFVILFTEHNDTYIIDTVASIFRRELKEARAPVSLQYDKKTLSDWTTILASVFKSVTWIERHPSHFKKAMLKLPFGKHAASLPSSAKMRAWSVPDIYWLASVADHKQWFLGVIHLLQGS